MSQEDSSPPRAKRLCGESPKMFGEDPICCSTPLLRAPCPDTSLCSTGSLQISLSDSSISENFTFSSLDETAISLNIPRLPHVIPSPIAVPSTVLSQSDDEINSEQNSAETVKNITDPDKTLTNDTVKDLVDTTIKDSTNYTRSSQLEKGKPLSDKDLMPLSEKLEKETEKGSDSVVGGNEKEEGGKEKVAEISLSLSTEPSASYTRRSSGSSLEDTDELALITLDELSLAFEAKDTTSVLEASRLGQEPDKPNPVPLKPSGLQVFVSNDENENEDNNNPAWDALRKLGERDRRLATRSRWGNIALDPKQDLTKFNWRRRNRLPQIRHTPSNSWDPRFSDSAGQHHCSALFEHQLRTANDMFEAKKSECKAFFADKFHDMDFKHSAEYQKNLFCSLMPIEQLTWRHREEVSSLHAEFRGALGEIEKAFEERVFKIRKAREELVTIHQYYSSLYPNMDFMTYPLKQFEAFIELDTMIQDYFNLYR